MNGEIIIDLLTKDLINKKLDEAVELANEISDELEGYIDELESMTSKYVDKNLLDDTEVIIKDMQQINEKFDNFKEFNRKVFEFFVDADHEVKS